MYRRYSLRRLSGTQRLGNVENQRQRFALLYSITYLQQALPMSSALVVVAASRTLYDWLFCYAIPAKTVPYHSRYVLEITPGYRPFL